MKITLTQWNLILEALAVAERVALEQAKTEREKENLPSKAFRTEGKAVSYRNLITHIEASEAR